MQQLPQCDVSCGCENWLMVDCWQREAISTSLTRHGNGRGLSPDIGFEPNPSNAGAGLKLTSWLLHVVLETWLIMFTWLV